MDAGRTASGEETDVGSVTVLFDRPASTPAGVTAPNGAACALWPTHAVVNVGRGAGGGAVVGFTNGVLRSHIRGVVSPPGAQASHTRCSLACFWEAGLKGLEGSDVIPALAEWEAEAQAEEGLSAKEWISGRGSCKRVEGTDGVSVRSRMGKVRSALRS